MKKPMSRLLASVLAAIMLINCMVVTALAADARVISMNYQPHPLYPGMNGNAVVEVDYGDSTGRGICVEPAKDGPAVGSTLSLSEADTTMTRYAYMASQTSDIYRTWCIHHAAANHLGLGNGSRDSGITAVENEVGSVSVPDSFEAFIGRPSNSSYQVTCGQDMTGWSNAQLIEHSDYHLDRGESDQWRSEGRQVKVGEHQEIDYYICSCGATKAP